MSPFTMIEVNAPPLVGENLLMLGGPAAVTVKVGPIACPPGVITCTGPGDAVGGTVAVIWVALFTTKLVALVRLKRTPVAPVIRTRPTAVRRWRWSVGAAR